jgi:hypothetical protein
VHSGTAEQRESVIGSLFFTGAKSSENPARRFTPG